MKKDRLKVFLVVLVALLVVSGAALLLKPRGDDPVSSSPPPPGVALRSDEMGVYLMTEGAKVGQPFEIRAEFYPRSASGDMEAFINLPQSAVYLDGDQLYRGPVKAGEGKVLKMKAVFLEPGRWAISAEGRVFMGDNFRGPFVFGSFLMALEVTASEARVFPLQVAPFRANLSGTSTGYEGPRSDFELLNKTDQQLFLVINDRDGINDLRSRGLAPARLWGKWGPNFPFDGYSPLYADFNNRFLVGVYDRQRTTTGYRAFIEGLVIGPAALNVHVRFAQPAAGLPVVQKPVSPYELRYLGRDLNRYQVNKPVEINFIMDGKVLSKQSAVLLRPWQGAIDFALPVEDLKAIAKEKISQRKDIPSTDLVLSSIGRGIGTEALGFVTSRYFFSAKSGRGYSIYLDPYGREVDGEALARVSGRARYALYYGGVEPKLKEMLDKKGLDDEVPVEIWWRANRPGLTYREVNQPMVEALRSRNINASVDDKLPFGRAVIPKKKIADALAPEGTVFIGIQEGK